MKKYKNTLSIVSLKDGNYGLYDREFKFWVAQGSKRDMVELYYSMTSHIAYKAPLLVG